MGHDHPQGVEKLKPSSGRHLESSGGVTSRFDAVERDGLH